MADPVLHLIAGPNGAGKSTLFRAVVVPATRLEFVNADVIAAERWPGDPATHAYAAARLAAERRAELIERGTSFVTETVFSHDSKLELVRAATAARYLVTLHVVLVTEDLAVARVAHRVDGGGHDVPEPKVRERYRRLWPLVAKAIELTDSAIVYDNTNASRPFRVVAAFERGAVVGEPGWPRWAPAELRATTD